MRKATSAELDAGAVAAACAARLQTITDWRAQEREAEIVYLMTKKRRFSKRWSRERAEAEHEAECQGYMTSTPDYIMRFTVAERRLKEIRALALAACGSVITVDPDDFELIHKHYVPPAPPLTQDRIEAAWEIIDKLFAEVKAYDEKLEDAANAGKDARPPEGDDYNTILGCVGMAESMLAVVRNPIRELA